MEADIKRKEDELKRFYLEKELEMAKSLLQLAEEGMSQAYSNEDSVESLSKIPRERDKVERYLWYLNIGYTSSITAGY